MLPRLLLPVPPPPPPTTTTTTNHDPRTVKVVAKELAACDRKLDHAQRKLAAGCLPIDPSIAPLFDLVPLR